MSAALTNNIVKVKRPWRSLTRFSLYALVSRDIAIDVPGVFIIEDSLIFLVCSQNWQDFRMLKRNMGVGNDGGYFN
jgi:hypothetical protein